MKRGCHFFFRICTILRVVPRYQNMFIIDSNREAIAQLCKSHGVSALSVFGSVLTERFNSESDIDFLVSFKSLPLELYADNFFSFQNALSELLKREVDLIEDKAIRNPVFRNNVDRTKVLVYGRV